ncbi:MAG TPA: type II toxin-antitoxin system VapC family toxin [Anaerolineales bacterium]|nr:type II toxin-antitoxin system VapC family toxin [Anaerolineales bacterium]
MRLLLDTHVLLWAVAEPGKIAEPYREQIESADNEVFFSAASVWELAIKMQVGRVDLPVELEEITQAATRMDFLELPLTAAHAAGTARLPLHHRDPFDRLLVAQALHEPLRLFTVDRALGKYSDLVEVIA